MASRARSSKNDQVVGRTSETDYFNEAWCILAEGGFGALTIASVVARLGVTKGSFYHHFRNWDAFVDRLLSKWEEEQTDAIIDLSERSGTAEDQVELLMKLAAGLPHRTEAAIRAWANNEPRVAAVVARVDRRRHSYALRILEKVVDGPGRAELFAAGAIALMVGAQQLFDDLSADQLYLMFAALQEGAGP